MNKKCFIVIMAGVVTSLSAFSNPQTSNILNEKSVQYSMINPVNTIDDTKSNVKTSQPAGETITIKVVPGEMRFDKTKFSVKAGSTVKIIVENPDFMQHNLLIAKPGSLDKVGNAADALAGMANGAELQYVPKIPEVLYSTPLLDQGDKFELTVKVPNVTGDYPFVCTFPGHWRIMHGIMTVTK